MPSEENRFENHEPVKPEMSGVLTMELFQERCGDLGMTTDDFAGLWKAAKVHSSNLPYHNWEHTLDVLSRTMDYADECEDNNTPVNRKVLFAAALFHDAFFEEDPSRRGFDSKESHSAAIFSYQAEFYGFSQEEIELGKQAIMATKLGNKPQTIEDRILVRADIDNVGGDYEDSFLPKTQLVHDEAMRRSGESISDSFKERTAILLSQYLANNLSLGDFDKSYDHWQGQAFNNLLKLVTTTETSRVPRQLSALLGRNATGGNPDLN
jgi:hypothetical protein